MIMKSYTDLEQSKKLAEILPFESADMCYRIVAYNPNDTYVYQLYCFVGTLESDIPCWSLAALLGVMPVELDDEYHTYLLNIDMDYKIPRYVHCSEVEHSEFPSWDFEGEELIDNVVESIIWLKENNLL